MTLSWKHTLSCKCIQGVVLSGDLMSNNTTVNYSQSRVQPQFSQRFTGIHNIVFMGITWKIYYKNPYQNEMNSTGPGYK